MSKFQVGDYVRIKQRDQICLSPSGTAKSGLNFSDDMYEYCGFDFTLEDETCGCWEKFGWYWDEDWLELYEPISDKLEIDKLL